MSSITLYSIKLLNILTLLYLTIFVIPFLTPIIHVFLNVDKVQNIKLDKLRCYLGIAFNNCGDIGNNSFIYNAFLLILFDIAEPILRQHPKPSANNKQYI